MLTSTLLPLVSLLSTTASAIALFTGAAYNVPLLTTWNSTQGNFTMSFFVNDPEPVANVTTTCGAAWDNITSFPSDWIPCQDSSVDWKLSAFAGIESFELQVKHSYVDVSVGPPPQDIATTFAKATFGSRNLTCKATYCTLNVNETAKLPVWAATA